MTLLWIVLKQGTGSSGYSTFGPVPASDVSAAVKYVAKGQGKYVAQGRGRYFAIPLDAWQGGCRDFTKGRGIEHVPFPEVGPADHLLDRLSDEHRARRS